MTIQTPNLLPEPDGRLWTAALMDAWMTGETVTCRFPQPGFYPGPVGQVVVDGADQAGMTINVRSATPNYAFRRRQFFSIVHSGRRYLHYVRQETVVAANGTATIPVGPMLRINPADGDVCEFAVPMIEGKLSGDSGGWTMIPARVQGLTFTITEIA